MAGMRLKMPQLFMRLLVHLQQQCQQQLLLLQLSPMQQSLPLPRTLTISGQPLVMMHLVAMHLQQCQHRQLLQPMQHQLHLHQHLLLKHLQQEPQLQQSQVAALRLHQLPPQQQVLLAAAQVVHMRQLRQQEALHQSHHLEAAKEASHQPRSLLR